MNRRKPRKEESSEEDSEGSEGENSDDEMMDEDAKENINVDLIDDTAANKVIGRGGTRQAKVGRSQSECRHSC